MPLSRLWSLQRPTLPRCRKAKESHAFTEKQINVMILISYGDFKTDGEIEKFLGLKKVQFINIKRQLNQFVSKNLFLLEISFLNNKLDN